MRLHRKLDNPSWRNEYERCDRVLIEKDANGDGMRSMLVGRLMAFLSFTHDDMCYPFTLVEWFLLEGDAPHEVTGMRVVKPEMEGGKRAVGLIHACRLHRSCCPSSSSLSRFLEASRCTFLVLVGCIYGVLC
ncbi:hypothetical protein JAAARDRAFT_698558 [Jaapia argillacea MUCL 33604]|uniref:Uncharacterized protein n=1 Tax=Jaapia argillacea MUCL 33604 TaxID=933084 RepID=A0A067PR56_9AGAM|nr:hypothetical protein JAAARDRAFT_698558 [Jaapia argillacea MUCL 33604]